MPPGILSSPCGLLEFPSLSAKHHSASMHQQHTLPQFLLCVNFTANLSPEISFHKASVCIRTQFTQSQAFSEFLLLEILGWGQRKGSHQRTYSLPANLSWPPLPSVLLLHYLPRATNSLFLSSHAEQMTCLQQAPGGLLFTPSTHQSFLLNISFPFIIKNDIMNTGELGGRVGEGEG